MGVLIDTCIWIDVERGDLAPLDVFNSTGEQSVYISPVTIAELQYGAEIAAEPSIRHKRLSALDRLKQKPLLVIDNQTGAIFGRLAAELNSTGRGSHFRTQDLWLASQSIQHSFLLLTRNIKDFQDIPGLQILTL
jgi:predicted nucleic acid-binding protein